MNKRAVRLLAIGIPLLVIGALAFKLLEYGLTYNWGWQRIPGGPYPAVTAHAPGWEAPGAEADAWLRRVRARLNAPALSAAVSVDGEVVWQGAAGFADLDSRTGATPETAFRIGSSSKPVTSVAMGVLLEEGSVDLDAPVSRYLPDLAEPLSSITTRQAMSHTAGVRDYGLCLCFPIWEYYNRRHYETQREALRSFERSALLFPPGKGFSYSSYGYNVAGAVVEGATGMGFGEFLEQRVFGPLGMDATHAATGEAFPGDASFYEIRDGEYKKVFRVDNTNKLAAGGIVSTPADMVALGSEVIAPTLFSVATRDLLTRPQALADGSPNPQGYALGWRSYEAELPGGGSTTRMLHHHGVAYGARSHFAVYPEQGVVVSIMTNQSSESLKVAEASALVDSFIGAVEPAKRTAVRALDGD